MSSQGFSREMRKATRDVHAISDALVNAKLVMSLSGDQVWADGLSVFYGVFRCLETLMENHKDDLLGRFLIEGLPRREKFEEDLETFWGKNWTERFNLHPEVIAYIAYLDGLDKEDSDLLIPFVYHLYMGLLSGGQILKRKRQLKDMVFQKNGSNKGYAITDFGDRAIPELKKEIRSIMDEIGLEVSEEKRQRLLVESRKVFEWNSKIIRTINVTDHGYFEKLSYILIVLFALIIIYWLW